MYKTIAFIAFGLLALFQCNAQERVALYASGTHFAQPVKDKKWRNTNGENSTTASYQMYSGLTYVTLTADGDTEAEINYSLKVDSGELSLVVATETGELLFDQTFRHSASGTAKVKLMAGVAYRINFTGKDTTGAYAANWKPL